MAKRLHNHTRGSLDLEISVKILGNFKKEGFLFLEKKVITKVNIISPIVKCVSLQLDWIGLKSRHNNLHVAT